VTRELDAHWPRYSEDTLQELVETARSGGVSFELDDRPARTLEHTATEVFGCAHALGLSSGTAVLHCALFALDVRPGVEVLCPTYTFFRTITPLLLHGGVPVLVDSEPDHENLDTPRLDDLVTSRTEGIVVTHMMGHPCDLDAVYAVARRHGLWVIEDASLAHGAAYRGTRIGAGPSDAVCFSLQGKKLVPAGQGGLLCTSRRDVFEKALLFSYFRPRLGADIPEGRGWDEFLHSGFGFNFQIHPLGAILATSHLRDLDRNVELRDRSCTMLRGGLAESTLVDPPVVREYATRHSWYRFRPIVRDPDAVDVDLYVRALQAEGVPVRRKRDPLLHEEPLLVGDGPARPEFARYLRPGMCARGEYPNAVRLADNTLELDFPLVPDPEYVEQVLGAFAKVEAELPALAQVRV